MHAAHAPSDRGTSVGERVLGAKVQGSVVIARVIVPAALVAVEPRVVVVVDRRNPLDLDEVDGAGEDQPARSCTRAAGKCHCIADVVVGQSVRRPSRLLVDVAQNQRPPRITGMERKGSPL